ncbi:MAG: hypothetical protein N2C14_22210, partial [Planctomycetales bacterium]
FPRSKLIPYALFRKGRSSQMDDKRFQAVKDYREILDFFPNEVKYASACLYFIGDCHRQNGDVGLAIKAWAKLADDKDYRREPLGAFAVNHLADYLVQQEKEAEAVKHYRNVAVDFRKSNPEASQHARDAAMRFYVRNGPNEPELRKFYTEMGAFDRNPREVTGDLDAKPEYWNVVRGEIHRHARFGKEEETARKGCFAYWSKQMEGKFTKELEYDAFHIDRAHFQRQADDDLTNWIAILDQQYDRLQSQADWKRTVQWMRLYVGMAPKVDQYFLKLNQGKLGKEGMIAVMQAVWETPDSRPHARGLIDKLPFDQITNQELASLANHFFEKDRKLTSRFIGKIDFAKMTGVEIGRMSAGFASKEKTISRSLIAKVRWAEMTDQEITSVARMFWTTDGETVR